MRISRTAAVGAALTALVVSACGPGAGSPSPSVTSPAAATSSPVSTPVANSLASNLIFGGPPECPERPFCMIGLRETYGLEFKEFKPLDVGGPITVEALAGGEIDVGLLFSSDPTIEARDFVTLDDDKGLQRADNLVPLISKALVDDHPDVASLLNSVTALLTQDELVELNRQATEDNADPRDIAANWLTDKGLLDDADESIGSGAAEITVGKTNFYEQDNLSELYAQILEANGFTVARQEASGSREVVFPALADGQIDVLPDYAATALEFVNQNAGQATADPDETTDLLRQQLELRGLTALDPAEAANQNAIVVTRPTAEQYGLQKISDLAKPAP
jgi:glycine betaine/choline ABC-type transport system substrate-binding protein